MKLFVIIKEKGKLCNFYTGLITSIISWNMNEVKILGVLHYSQYDRLYTAKEPEKFKTIKEFVYDAFPVNVVGKKGKDAFITKMLQLTSANQMWVHDKSQVGDHRCLGDK